MPFITQEQLDKMVAAQGNPEEPKVNVKFTFSSLEKMSIYQDVLYRIRQGGKPEEIATAIVMCMEEHLKEKEDKAYNKSGPKVSGFRRVE